MILPSRSVKPVVRISYASRARARSGFHEKERWEMEKVSFLSCKHWINQIAGNETVARF